MSQRSAGVSKGLVSFALNDRPGVSADTRGRILAVAEELGWRPSVRARSLSVDRSFALGLVIGRSPDVIAADPFFHAFIAGVESEFSTSGQVLVLAAATPGRAEAETYRGLAADKRVDGVILTDLRAGDERIPLVSELGLAAVTLGRPDGASPFPAVSVDDGVGIRTAVEHLVSLGHARIAHVAGPSTMLHGHRRAVAFEAAMRHAGLDGALVVETDFSASAGARATTELLDRPDRPTAIVYSNDHMAIAGLAAARRAGIAVPRRPLHHRVRQHRARRSCLPLADVGRDGCGRLGRGRRANAAGVDRRGITRRRGARRSRLVVRESTTDAPT